MNSPDSSHLRGVPALAAWVTALLLFLASLVWLVSSGMRAGNADFISGMNGQDGTASLGQNDPGAVLGNCLLYTSCMYCGFCERFACEYDAKAQPSNTFIPAAEKTGNCEIRCNSNVVEILRKDGMVAGVRYVDTLTKEEFIQPADVVVLSGYVMNLSLIHI